MKDQPAPPVLSNAAIADRLASLAQLLSTQKENPFKVKAYRRAAETIRALPDSVEELVRRDVDLTEYSRIGKGISRAIREIVLSGSLRKLESLRSQVTPEVAAINQYPRLDPKRVLRIYKKLNISSIEALKEKLDNGEIARTLGVRMDQHVRQALIERREMPLYDAEDVASAVEEYLLNRCDVSRAEVTGDYRRRVETIAEISFLVETDDFPAVISKLERYGGKSELLESGDSRAVFRLSSGTRLTVETARKEKWRVGLIASTGSENHLRKLQPLSPPQR